MTRPDSRWLITREDDGSYSVNFMSKDACVLSIDGLSTKVECMYFLALYLSLMSVGKKDDAGAFLQAMLTRGVQ